MTTPIGHAGIFVGGRSRRMGRTKGLLLAPDRGEAIVMRTVRVAREAGLEPCLVGDAAPYGDLATGLTVIADAPGAYGPLGGLLALLTYAAAAGERVVVSLACDMPYIEPALLARIARGSGLASAAIVAPRGDGGYEAMCARYDVPAVLSELHAALAEGVRSFQALFARVGAVEFPVDDTERASLRDWDTPEDAAVDPHTRDGDG